MSLNTKVLSAELARLKQQINGVDEDRRRVVTAVVAKAVAYALPLPGQKVESFRQWYLQQAEPLAKELVGTINEVSVVDVRMTLELSFQILRARYAVAFDPIAVPLHKLVDQLVAHDDSKSIEGGYRGIFERVVATESYTKDSTSYLANLLTESLTGGN